MCGRSIAAMSSGVSVVSTSAGSEPGGVAISRTHFRVENDLASRAGPPRHVLAGIGTLF